MVYHTYVKDGKLQAADDAAEIGVFKKVPPKLAFDHRKMLNDYYIKI